MDTLQSLREIFQEQMQPLVLEVAMLRAELADLRATSPGQKPTVNHKLSTAEAAKALGIGYRRLLSYVKDGVLPVDGAAVANLSIGDRPTYKFDIEECSKLIKAYEELSPAVREQMYGERANA